MLGLLGFAPLIPYLGWLGYLGATALLGVLGVAASGCPSSQGPNEDEGSGDSGPDSKPPDIGTDGYRDSYTEVRPDGFYSPEGTRLGDIILPDLKPPDLKKPPDFTPSDLTPSGINFKAFTFLGPIVDLDPGKLGPTVLVGPPTTGVSTAGVYDCQVSGLGSANCQLKADLSTKFPTGSNSMPINYYRTSFSSGSSTPVTDGGSPVSDGGSPDGGGPVIDYGIVIGAPPGTGNPIDIFKIDLKTMAVTGTKNIVQIKDPGSGWSYIPAFPWGAVAYYDKLPKRERIFVATSNSSTNSTMGTIMSLSTLYGWAGVELPIIIKATGTSGLAMTKITYKGSSKTVLVALNSGKVDTSDKYVAGISVYDPEEEDAAKMYLKTISLGEVACAMMPELALDATGKTAYVPIEDDGSQKKQLALVNLETGVISYISLGKSVVGKIPDMVVDGANAYIADGSKRVVFVDLGGAKVKGYVNLLAAPTSLTVLSGIVYVGCGNDLAAIDPSKVTLQTP